MAKRKVTTEVNDATLEAMLTMLRTGGIYTSKALVGVILTCWELLEDKQVESITIHEVQEIVSKFRQQYPEPTKQVETQKK
jgi:hypothetical protein